MAKGVRLKQSTLSHGGDLEATCGLTAALLIWERQVVVPRSIALLDSPVVRVRHYGTYSCRNVNHAKEGKRSAHAAGKAIEIAGFDLADGRKISVLKDWGKNTPEGHFLTDINDQASRIFNVGLGQDYNVLPRK